MKNTGMFSRKGSKNNSNLKIKEKIVFCKDTKLRVFGKNIENARVKIQNKKFS